MSKMDLGWHRNCYATALENFERDLKRHQEVERELDRRRNDLAVYAYQISRAEAEGREGFDREKFNKRRAFPAARNEVQKEKS